MTLTIKIEKDQYFKEKIIIKKISNTLYFELQLDFPRIVL